jgi:hypothetical protein
VCTSAFFVCGERYLLLQFFPKDSSNKKNNITQKKKTNSRKRIYRRTYFHRTRTRDKKRYYYHMMMMMMMMMSSTPRSRIHSERAQSAQSLCDLVRSEQRTRRGGSEGDNYIRGRRRIVGARFRSCQPCHAFGARGGQNRDPFAPTKQKVAPTLSSSSAVLQEDEKSELNEKSELSNSFEKEKKENDTTAKILCTPRERRRENGAEITPSESEIRFVSLSELFGKKFSQVFHTEAAFRTGLRSAMREDLFRESAILSEQQNNAIKSLNSSLMVPWGQIPNDSELSALTKLFKEYEITGLTGKKFIAEISKLCGENPHGSLIDISNPALNRKKMKHSWHQDSGLEDRFTVMLGFPSENLSSADERKEGVFSHAVRLSHKVFWPNDEVGSVIEWESFPCGEPKDHEIAESYIIRPLYGIEQEIMVYGDAVTLHSAPDYIDREAVWRFM